MKELKTVIEEMLYATLQIPRKSAFKRPVPEELLFFPRNTVYVSKASPNTNSFTWLIRKNTGNKSCSLQYSTESSGIALVSGLRGSVIRLDDGRYVKLKGVRPKTHLRSDRYVFGMYYLESAVREQSVADSLLALEGKCFGSLSPQKPFFVEAIPPLYGKVTIDELLEMEPSKLFEYTTPEEMRKHKSNFMKDYPREIICAISGLEIRGDTRLDEAIYCLTLKDHRGEKKASRDRLLKYLSFHAGMKKGYLRGHNLTWGFELAQTNNHIGNFVLYDYHGTLAVGITDLSTITPPEHFKTKEEFDSFAQKEFEAYRQDFFDKATYSPTVKFRYRHFPRQLRQDCLDAFSTGYSVVLTFMKYAYKKIKIDYPIKPVERVVGLDDYLISTEEFRHECKRLS
jgi:hypothetical protein